MMTMSLSEDKQPKSFEEWNKGLQDLETIAFGAKEWTIPSPHTPTSIWKTDRINLNMKIVGRNIISRFIEWKSSFSFHSTTDWAKSHFERKCIIQELYLIMQSLSSILLKRACTDSDNCKLFRLLPRAIFNTLYWKVLQLWTTYQGRLHAPIC